MNEVEGWDDMIIHKGTQNLSTKRLHLRPFYEEDARDIYANWAGDGEVVRYLHWGPYKDIAETSLRLSEWLRLYRYPHYYHWAITKKDEGAPIGSISVEVQYERTKSCEVGYCLGKEYWGQGIMPEALWAVMDYLYYEIGYERIEARYDILNVASGKVMQKVGMSFHKIMYHANRRRDGSYYDCVIYGKNRIDHKKQNID